MKGDRKMITDVNKSEDGLQRGLKQRHITMIAIGGVIGGGLFLGSGKGILTYGPAIVLAYLFAGLLVICIMRMLGEMTSVRLNTTGSFMAFASEAFGPLGGHITGWLYWFFWMYIIALEAVFGAQLLNSLLPGIFPLEYSWLVSLVLTILLTLSNCFSVRNYGEFEFRFATIKVATVCVFLCLGLLIMVGAIPSFPSPGLTNILNVAHGGFAPYGWSAVPLGFLFIMFAFFGAEIGAIAVRESDNPEKAIHTVINSVVWRILLFYIGSILIISLVLSSVDKEHLVNPYASIFDMAGIPYAGTIVTCVVLTSVLSCLNSALYTNSRMLFGLAQEGNAPKALLKLNKHGVPVRAVIASTTFSYIAVIIQLTSNSSFDLFGYIANAAGAIAVLVYIMIAASHIKLRKANPDLPYKIKMWGFPYLSYVLIALLVGAVGMMFFIAELRLQLISTIILAVITIALYFLTHRKSAGEKEDNSVPSLK
jgi:GABA permease